MTIKTHLLWSSLCLLFLLVQETSAQQLLIVNGGSFGSATEKANLGVFNASTGLYTHIDTIYTNSVQDVLIEADRYAYVAAQDSIVKYDLWSGQRLAATAFGASSTIKLGLYNNALLVGNWYGASTGNLRIFDKYTLDFQDSIPEITKGAQDFVVLGDFAYISQNNTSGSWSDTLGYLAVVNLNTLSFVRNDTLSTIGEELGRLVNVGDTAIYSLNSVSNTISYYHIPTANSNTVMAAGILSPKSYGGTAYQDGINSWYLPFNNGIGTFDLVNNSVLSADIITTAGGTAFAVDTVNNQIYLSYINYVNQSLNQGIYYNSNGDSLGTFPVGISPEVLAIWYSNVTLNTNSNFFATELNVKAFPNPVVDYLNIQTSANIKAVRVSDLQGRILYFSEINAAKQAQIDLSNFAAGTYFLTVWDENGRVESQSIIVR
jgi:hypothetical protein